MTDTGKTIRLKRILDENGKAVIFAPVHHMFSAEPFPGEIDVKKSVKESIEGQATAIVISKGFLKLSASVWKGGVGVLNCPCTYAALSPKPIQQVTISSVEETFRLGADGVCVFVGLATENDPYVMELLGKIGEECDKYGLVFVAEAEFPGFYSSQEEHRQKYGLKYLKYTARLCAELGCDLVSTNWPGDEESFAEIVDFVKIPLLVNGGPKMPELEFLKMVEGSIKAGGAGCLVGRNLSEVDNIEKMTRATARVVKEGLSAEDAIKYCK